MQKNSRTRLVENYTPILSFQVSSEEIQIQLIQSTASDAVEEQEITLTTQETTNTSVEHTTLTQGSTTTQEPTTTTSTTATTDTATQEATATSTRYTFTLPGRGRVEADVQGTQQSGSQSSGRIWVPVVAALSSVVFMFTFCVVGFVAVSSIRKKRKDKSR